jgi:hypothetical protein
VLACGRRARASDAGDALWVSASSDDRHAGTREQPLETMQLVAGVRPGCVFYGAEH